MTALEDIARDLGFPATHLVEGRSSVADLFPRRNRCGIYLLHFSDGQAYIGQSTDVTRRFVQHRHSTERSDIVRISFMPVPRVQLNERERSLTQSLELHGYPHRGIALAGVPVIGERDFDLIMPVDDQERWLRDLAFIDSSGDRVIDPDLRRRYHARYQSFLGKPFAADTLSLLRRYVQVGVPAFRRGEIAFWNATCLPTYNDRRVVVYSRININAQEVFNVFESDGVPSFSWHLAKSPLQEAFGLIPQARHSRGRIVDYIPEGDGDPANARLPGLARLASAVEVFDHWYKPGGRDQVNVVVSGVDNAWRLLEDATIQRAMRRMNLALSRKGPALNKGNHCLDLADHLVE